MNRSQIKRTSEDTPPPKTARVPFLLTYAPIRDVMY